MAGGLGSSGYLVERLFVLDLRRDIILLRIEEPLIIGIGAPWE